MRVCVFVDGENLRHTIVDLYKPVFNNADYLPKQADWSALFDSIVSKATNGTGLRQRTYWYVSQDFGAYPRPQSQGKRALEHLERWAKRNQKHLTGEFAVSSGTSRLGRLVQIQDELTQRYNRMRARFDGFATVQNGISLKHRSVEFRRSGAIPYNLITSKFGQEKTVDVNLAVDMVTLHDNYDLAIIVSGDQDYVPAAQAVKNMGKHVINAAFKARNGRLLPGGAVRLNQVTDWSVEIDYEPFRILLGIPETTAAAGMEVTIEEEPEAV